MIVEKIGLIYIIEMLMYYLAYYIIYGRWLKRYWIPISGLIVYYFLIYSGTVSGSLESTVIACLIAAVVVFVLPRVNLRERITVTFMLLFVFYCVMNFMLTIADAIIVVANKDRVFNGDARGTFGMPQIEVKSFIVLLVQLVGLCVIALLKKHISDNSKMKLYNLLQRNMVLLVLVSGLFLAFALAGLDWIRNQILDTSSINIIDDIAGDKSKRFYCLSLILSAFSNLCICVWGLFSIYTESMNKKMEHMIDNEKAMVSMQKNYYDALLEREEDTRKYRHDMINHLICLDEMVKQEKYDEVKSYISNMHNGIMEIRNKTYYVGNDIIDILTNHYVGLVSENTKVNVKGNMNCDFDPTKLCTIYSNLLQNAVEELAKCDGESELTINFAQSEKYVKISISNTLAEDDEEEFHTSILDTSILKSKGFRTSKKDKSNHGLGLRNVKKTIEDMNGTFEVSKDNGLFTAYVYLKV